jgi:hypothetical protein
MATVLEEFPTEEQRSLVYFLWKKGLNVNDIHKEIIPDYGGKCLSRKAAHNCVKKFSQRHSKVADDARPSHPVETATEGRTGNAMGQVYQCWCRICREINVSFIFEYYMFNVLYQFMIFLLTLPCIQAALPVFANLL